MKRLLIPDSGPLFSLAVANELALLSNFSIGISDIVRAETINRGLLPNPSAEAQRLIAYYNQNALNIETFPTQVGIRIAAEMKLDPNYRLPANLGELSIQSLLIDLHLSNPGSNPVVLFEDGWFLQNASSFAKPCLLISTQAFLEYAEEMQWIPSAELVRKSIATARPGAYQKSVTIQHR